MANRTPTFPIEPGQAARDVEMIYRLFVQAEAGQTITYTEISEVVGKHGKGGDSRIHRAIRRARKDGVNMENIRDVGYRRDSAQDTINESIPKHLKRMRSAANQGVRKLRTVDVSELNNSERVDYHMQVAVLGSTRMVLSDKNQVEQRNSIKNSVLNISRRTLIG